MLVCCYETKSIYIFERTLLLDRYSSSRRGMAVAILVTVGVVISLHSSTEIAITVAAVSHTAAFTVVKATDACSHR